MNRRARPKHCDAMRAGAAAVLIALSVAALTGLVPTRTFVAQPSASGAQLPPTAAPLGIQAATLAQANAARVLPARSDAALVKFALCGLLLCLPWRQASPLRKRCPAACRVVGCSEQAVPLGFVTSQPLPRPAQAAPAPPPSATPAAAQPAGASRPSVPQTFYIGEPSVGLAAVPPLEAPAARDCSQAPAAPTARGRRASARFVAGARRCSAPRTRASSTARAAAAAEREERRAVGAKLQGRSSSSGLPVAEPRAVTYDASRVRGPIQRGLLDTSSPTAEHGSHQARAPSMSIARDVFTDISRAGAYLEQNQWTVHHIHER